MPMRVLAEGWKEPKNTTGPNTKTKSIRKTSTKSEQHTAKAQIPRQEKTKEQMTTFIRSEELQQKKRFCPMAFSLSFLPKCIHIGIRPRRLYFLPYKQC